VISGTGFMNGATVTFVQESGGPSSPAVFLTRDECLRRLLDADHGSLAGRDGGDELLRHRDDTG